MPSADEHVESIRARGGNHEAHGCARHAPAGPADLRTETPARRSFTARRRRSFNAASGNFRESIFSTRYSTLEHPKPLHPVRAEAVVTKPRPDNMVFTAPHQLGVQFCTDACRDLTYTRGFVNSGWSLWANCQPPCKAKSK